MKEHPEKNPNELASWGLYAYADALANQVSAGDIFSCADHILLAYRNEMQEKFGMEILTPEEGKEREQQRSFTRRVVDVTDEVERVVEFAERRRNSKDKLN